jgi:hypothetical protein
MATKSLDGRRLGVIVVVLFAVGLAGAAGQTQAQGWMAGLNVGQSKTHDYSIGEGGAVAHLDDTHTAYSAFGGYSFLKYFGGVAAYVDLGTLNADGPSFGGYTDEIKVHGFYIGPLGMLPVHQRVGLFATTGAFFWNQKVHYAAPGDDENFNESGASFAFGAGANVDLTPAHTLGLHLEWMMFRNVGDRNKSGHRYDRSFLALGVVYRFPHR